MAKGSNNPAFQADETGGSPPEPPVEEKAPNHDAASLGDAESAGGEPERAQWSNGMEFLMSCIAMSVGLGNVWRFPFTAYENGGGAFLIPYIIVLIIIGRPLYYLEMGLGQFTSRGCVKIWNMAPALRGVGYGQILATACILSYYTSLMALTLFYFVMSFQETLPWTWCRDDWGPCIPSGGGNATNVGPGTEEPRSSAELFFQKFVLGEPDNLDDGFGPPDWRLTLCLLGSWLGIVGVVIQGVRSSGKASYFLALFPYVIMVVLLIRGVTLPGAGDGLLYFVDPQWEKLGDAKVWYSAVTQAFFSLNVGFGSLINYSSYNGFRHNIYRDAMIVTTLDTFTSLLAGCTIFAILGNLAHEMGVEGIDSVVKSGAGLAFISYPDAIAKFDTVPQLFAVLFFLMMFTLGLGSAVALLSAIITIISDNFKGLKHWMISCALFVMGFLIGLVYVTPAGQWILTLVDHFGATYPVLALMCVEMSAIAWLYGVDNISNDFSYMLNRKSTSYWRLTWGLITPVFLLIVLLYAAINDEKLMYADKLFPDHYYAVGWTLLGVVVAFCPCFIIIEVGSRWFGKNMTFSEAFLSSFRPSADWGPSDKQAKEEWGSERERLRHRTEAANESLTRAVTRKVCGCGTLPLLADEELPDDS